MKNKLGKYSIHMLLAVVLLLGGVSVLIKNQAQQVFVGEDWVNVKNFGAVANGKHDDTDSIMMALHSIETNGGVLYFPEGKYCLSRTIDVENSSIAIMGAGKNKTHLIFLEDESNAIRVSGGKEGISNFCLSDLSVEYTNSKSKKLNKTAAVHIGRQVGDYQIKNISIINATYGIYLKEAYSGFIENVEIGIAGRKACKKGIIVDVAIATHFNKVKVLCCDTAWEVNGGVDTLTLMDCNAMSRGPVIPRFGLRLVNTYNPFEKRHDPRWLKAENCSMHVSPKGVGYAFESGYGNELINCSCYGGLHALNIANAHDIEIVGGRFVGYRQKGAVIKNAENLLVEGAIFDSGSREDGSGKCQAIVLGSNNLNEFVEHIRIINCLIRNEESVFRKVKSPAIEIKKCARNYYICGNRFVNFDKNKICDMSQSDSKKLEDNMAVSYLKLHADSPIQTLHSIDSYWAAMCKPTIYGKKMHVNIINVKNFGAIGNGVHDDGDSIQQAINSIKANGGIVYFPAGEYRFKNPIVIKRNNIAIIGNGVGNTVLSSDSVDSNAIEIVGAKGFYATKLSLVCFDHANGKRIGGSGILIKENASEFTLEDLQIINGYTGIKLKNAHKGVLKNVKVKELADSFLQPKGSNDGIVISDSSNIVCTYVDTYVHNAGWIIESSANDVMLFNCGVQKTKLVYENNQAKTVTDSIEPKYGIFVRRKTSFASPKNILIKSFYAEVSNDYGTAFYIKNGENISIESSYNAWGKTACHIANANNISIVAGEYFGCMQTGMIIENGKDIIVDGLSLTAYPPSDNGKYSGINVSSKAKNIAIVNCRIGGDSLLQTGSKPSFAIILQGTFNSVGTRNNDLSKN